MVDRKGDSIIGLFLFVIPQFCLVVAENIPFELTETAIFGLLFSFVILTYETQTEMEYGSSLIPEKVLGVVVLIGSSSFGLLIGNMINMSGFGVLLAISLNIVGVFVIGFLIILSGHTLLISLDKLRLTNN